MAMNELYYDAGESHDFLNKLVNDNVLRSTAWQWEEDPPIATINQNTEGVTIHVIGPDKPTDFDPSGASDCYTVDFSFAELLDDVADGHELDDGRNILNAIIESAKKALSELEDIATRDES